jgi:hypothetical protein
MNTNRHTAIKERSMKPTASNLIRWAGLAAMVAGIFYVVVGLFHPLETLSSATPPDGSSSTPWPPPCASSACLAWWGSMPGK